MMGYMINHRVILSLTCAPNGDRLGLDEPWRLVRTRRSQMRIRQRWSRVRDYCLAHSRLAFFIYTLVLKIKVHYFWPGMSISDWYRYVENNFGRPSELSRRILETVRRDWTIWIPFLPKSWSQFAWGVSMVRHPGYGFWKNLDLHLGLIASLGIRWRNFFEGRRYYVSLRLGLYRGFVPGVSFNSLKSRYMLIHETWQISNDPKFPVSLWYWGSGQLFERPNTYLEDIFCRAG